MIKILVWGMGKSGKSFLKQIKNDDECKIVGITDSKIEQSSTIKEFDGITVYEKSDWAKLDDCIVMCNKI